MGFFSKAFSSIKNQVGSQVVQSLPVIGGAIGGPAGAMLGEAAAGALSDALADSGGGGGAMPYSPKGTVSAGAVARAAKSKKNATRLRGRIAKSSAAKAKLRTQIQTQQDVIAKLRDQRDSAIARNRSGAPASSSGSMVKVLVPLAAVGVVGFFVLRR